MAKAVNASKNKTQPLPVKQAAVKKKKAVVTAAVKPRTRPSAKQAVEATKAKGKAVKAALQGSDAVEGNKKLGSKAKARKEPATPPRASAKGGPKASPKAAPEAEQAEQGERLNVGRFYAISQCSLKAEAKELMDKTFELHDPEAKKLWPAFERMAKRNLGSNEKWVPFHTVLGVHERFVVEEVHHANVPWWTEYHRFVAMFIFRAHCKRDLFSDVQMPFLRDKAFWKNLAAGFKPDSPMEKAIAKFRQKGVPLQTSCFLIIPERILKDDDANLIRNLILRTQRLIGLADDLWHVVNDKKTTSEKKYDIITEKILTVKGLGDTWVKMLMVVIDIAKPHLKLLQDRCEVGNGASDPLRKILEDEGLLKPKEKRVMGERRAQAGGYVTTPSLKQGIIAVKKNGVQLIQVTEGMAGSLDKAQFIAERLAELANKGMTSQDKLKVERQKFFDNKSLKVPKLGLDEKAAEMRKNAAENPTPPKDPNEPTPSQALMQLRSRINESKDQSSQHFWNLLEKVETHARKHFNHLPLVVAQMKTPKKTISAATLQVQLCEVRQFDNYVTRPTKRSLSEISLE